MKKIVISFFAGFGLATDGSVYAEDIVTTMVGKKVEGEFAVKVDGNKLDKKAIVIDDTSYLPVRAIGEALDMDVTFNADLGIELTEKETTTVEATTTTEMSAEDAENVRISEEQIVLAQNRIKEKEQKIAEMKKDLQSENDKLATATDEQQEKQLIKMNIKSIQSNIDGAQFQIDEDNKIIASTQAYIAKIKAKYQTTP